MPTSPLSDPRVPVQSGFAGAGFSCPRQLGYHVARRHGRGSQAIFNSRPGCLALRSSGSCGLPRPSALLFGGFCTRSGPQAATALPALGSELQQRIGGGGGSSPGLVGKALPFVLEVSFLFARPAVFGRATCICPGETLFKGKHLTEELMRWIVRIVWFSFGVPLGSTGCPQALCSPSWAGTLAPPLPQHHHTPLEKRKEIFYRLLLRMDTARSFCFQGNSS